MKTCPNCKKVNDGSSTYCSSCGYRLVKPKRSRSFRNFIITVSIVFSVILLGLIALFLFNTGLKGIFRQQLTSETYYQEGREEAEGGNNNQENTCKISGDQERVLSVFGYPDQFIILFDEGLGNKRIDSWMYEDMEACFLFEEGLFIGSDDYYIEESGPGKYSVNPFDFNYGMIPSEVEEVLGEQGEESLEETTGLKLLIFGNGEVICVFNDQDGLIGISRNSPGGYI